ncbi:hypothetical protein P700755_001246 [Psychroflexus torquis ATCC 700755]|uniref:Uncharacterized protein n=1 Tax=Psychroflexus torquis (strain ATCC 700755 / CIP 106069 / ACAM 623) TaxID=313595 RepID=K4IEA8_PSYTT|nr:hypothetical protein [Psychroflexus torquis]AFU68183.1 hypothetical protein P700755_001246 [Psychroflexus torquis ATCC 700755]
MGKSFIKLIIILSCNTLVLAQDSLCVFKTKGIVLIESINIKKSLIKGDFIKPKSNLSVLPNSEISVIDANGHIYFINKAGDYSFNELYKYEKTKQGSNLTSDYFKYIWSELLDKGSNKAIIAGVYRGGILMKFPRDSSKIYNSKITLKWDLVENEKLYYVFLKNIATNEILKIESNGSRVSLYKNQHIFSEGTQFDWAVSTSEFPNVKNLYFFNFTLIDKNTYADLKLNYKNLIKDLENLGLSETEIETSICNTYGLCK